MLPVEHLPTSLPEACHPRVGPEASELSTASNQSLEKSQKNSDLILKGRPHLLVHSQKRSSSASSRSESNPPRKENHEVPRHIIVDSFAPRVTCYASSDADEFIILKGFKAGLRELLCSFGERVQGKVVIRDSLGVGREWEDFGVRFIDPSSLHYVRTLDGSSHENISQSINAQAPPEPLDITTSIDNIVRCHFESQDRRLGVDGSHNYDVNLGSQSLLRGHESVYSFYLRKLLSSRPIVPYETFSHPVACIIAVSSRNTAPLDSLRQLYESSTSGRYNMPPWVSTNYLRYYVLIHDEENDDITKSTALFDLMKRHFGLHCHLLRLRSSHCVPTDDDSFQVPSSEWLSADEELDRLRRSDNMDIENEDLYIHDSDATAVKGFVREMVTQSLIPFMEGRVTTWNDQVASRRRGISARFMSLSKRIAGFGSSKATPSGSPDSSGLASNNFDSLGGYYAPETSEAILRQLGDYAFMLRDWKLAHTTYELVRTDFGNDKAWKHHAAATEMSAISFLLTPQSTSAKSRSEMIDQLLNTASYSYLIRSSMAFGAIRCLTVAVELLKYRGAHSAEEAARWGGKLLELRIMKLTAQAFMSERMADSYRSRLGAGRLAVGSRRRQAAFWDLLAATTWIYHGTTSRAHDRLGLAATVYQQPPDENSWRSANSSSSNLPFASMLNFWEGLEQAMVYEPKSS